MGMPFSRNGIPGFNWCLRAQVLGVENRRLSMDRAGGRNSRRSCADWASVLTRQIWDLLGDFARGIKNFKKGMDENEKRLRNPRPSRTAEQPRRAQAKPRRKLNCRYKSGFSCSRLCGARLLAWMNIAGQSALENTGLGGGNWRRGLRRPSIATSAAHKDGEQELLLVSCRPRSSLISPSKTPPKGRAARPNAVAARTKF